MPGIVGLVTAMPPERAKADVAQMLASIRHEPFYTAGTWCDESLGIYLGWTVRTGAFADRLPLSNVDGSVVLAFSGEDYPEPGTAGRDEADRPGGASYLVRRYDTDPAFPRGLNGRFHGVVADRRRRTAMLFNDRYGMHRVYYHRAAEGFYFAAEAKAILAVCPLVRTPDPQGLGEFLACGCVMENRTLFKGVEVLPPASAWSFENAALAAERTYFRPEEWETQAPLEPEQYYQALRDVFTRNLPRYFTGAGRIGVSLTGGLDTRAIMAWRRPAPGSLPCYTFGSMFRDNRDVRVARQVAAACAQPHTVIRVGEEFLARFPHYAERSVYLSDGCAELSRTSDLYVSERARSIAPTKVVGTYGSEVLTHATMFRPAPLAPGLLHADVKPHLQQAIRTYDRVRFDHPVTFAAFRQSPWWHYGVLALEQTQLTVRSPYLDNEFVKTVFRAPAPTSGPDVRLRLIADGSPALRRIPTDLGVAAGGWRLPSFATRVFQKLTFKAEYAYDYSMPQWLAMADRACSRLGPERLFLGRHKVSHYRVWYRDALAGYVQDMLLDGRALSRPYLDRRGVQALVRGHVEGRRNYTRELHRLLTLEIAHRLFFDRP